MQYSWQLLRAGAFRLDGGSMFGVVPRALWSRMAPPDERNRIDLQTNCLLLRSDERTVLVETGYGGKWDEKSRDIFHLEPRTIVDALAEAAIVPDDITDVVVTHLHFDHAGGLTYGHPPRSTFARARIHVQDTEWTDALANKSTMTRTYLRSHLDPIVDQVEAHRGLAQVVPGITVAPLPGHTWGHQSVRFRDDHGTVCFAGDVCPTRHHAGAAFSMGYDMLPYENMRSKESLFQTAEAEGWRLVLDHEPSDPVCMVVRGERGFELRS